MCLYIILIIILCQLAANKLSRYWHTSALRMKAMYFCLFFSVFLSLFIGIANRYFPVTSKDIAIFFTLLIVEIFFYFAL